MLFTFASADALIPGEFKKITTVTTVLEPRAPGSATTQPPSFFDFAALGTLARGECRGLRVACSYCRAKKSHIYNSLTHSLTHTHTHTTHAFDGFNQLPYLRKRGCPHPRYT